MLICMNMDWLSRVEKFVILGVWTAVSDPAISIAQIPLQHRVLQIVSCHFFGFSGERKINCYGYKHAHIVIPVLSPKYLPALFLPVKKLYLTQ